MIPAFFLNKVVVCPAFGDLSFFDHQYLVSFTNGCQREAGEVYGDGLRTREDREIFDELLAKTITYSKEEKILFIEVPARK